MVTLHGHFIKMKITKTEVLISILVLVALISLISLKPEPQYSINCGECTEWVDDGCGLGECEEDEMKQSRTCTGDIFSDENPAMHDPWDPLTSPQYSLGEVPPECIKRCIPMPEICTPSVPENPVEEPQNPNPSTGTPRGECDSGELKCEDNSLLECISRYWEVREVCENGCEVNQCIIIEPQTEDTNEDLSSDIEENITEDIVIENPEEPRKQVLIYLIIIAISLLLVLIIFIKKKIGTKRGGK